MSDSSKIEWTDATWNPTRGCTKIAQGCKNCYAETFAERWRGILGHPYEQGFDPRIAPEQLTVPLKWKKPRRIFVDSMSDLFHEDFPFEYIAACFGVMAVCQQHTFQVLTKRPQRAAEFFDHYATWSRPADEMCQRHAHARIGEAFPLHKVKGTYRSYPWPLPNVHIGTSASTQREYAENVTHLAKIPAAVHFLSLEPLIESISLGFDGSFPGIALLDHLIHWVIVGGESGSRSRPCNVGWIRSIVGQCRAAGVPVFVKQMGRHAMGAGSFDIRHIKGSDMSEWPADLRVREVPA